MSSTAFPLQRMWCSVCIIGLNSLLMLPDMMSMSNGMACGKNCGMSCDGWPVVVGDMVGVWSIESSRKGEVGEGLSVLVNEVEEDVPEHVSMQSNQYVFELVTR